MAEHARCGFFPLVLLSLAACCRLSRRDRPSHPLPFLCGPVRASHWRAEGSPDGRWGTQDMVTFQRDLSLAPPTHSFRQQAPYSPEPHFLSL